MHTQPATDQAKAWSVQIRLSIDAYCRAQHEATKRTLTPEERERVRKARILRKLQKKRVRVNGKRVRQCSSCPT